MSLPARGPQFAAAEQDVLADRTNEVEIAVEKVENGRVAEDGLPRVGTQGFLS